MARTPARSPPSGRIARASVLWLHELTFRIGAMQQKQWLDFLPYPAIGVTITKKFCAAAMQDGCINSVHPDGQKVKLEAFVTP
ncbi:hypothetical protein BDM02DRAFT_3190241 [Thelephora ganbajun]|uniref:Uncharacterized protein n=1 Tax=Thelephora ganbajun TaxID=370292 RepID=A0ACB6Z676_THEGA|nr:hypothetical protein BDM02DRAFT_3190241 [Thelephora ganbajun]